MLSGEGGGGEGEGWIFYFIFYFFLVAATVGLQGAGRAAAAAVAYDVYSVELSAVRCIFWWKSPCGVSDGARASWRIDGCSNTLSAFCAHLARVILALLIPPSSGPERLKSRPVNFEKINKKKPKKTMESHPPRQM